VAALWWDENTLSSKCRLLAACFAFKVLLYCCNFAIAGQRFTAQSTPSPEESDQSGSTKRYFSHMLKQVLEAKHVLSSH